MDSRSPKSEVRIRDRAVCSACANVDACATRAGPAGWLEQAGLEEVQVEVVGAIDKEIDGGGGMKAFPLLVGSGRRRGAPQ